jgi:hypothetical protein
MKAPAKTQAQGAKKSQPFPQSQTSAKKLEAHATFSRPMPTARAQNEFTREEHLRVQREIEERAHRFWLAKGRVLKTALNDWLLAEAEVLAEFVKSRTQDRPVPPAAGDPVPLTGGASYWRPKIRLPLYLPDRMTA